MGKPTEFDTFAHEYDSMLRDSLGALGNESDYFASHKTRFVSKLLKHLKRPKVLDFGCGVGKLSSSIQSEITNTTIHGYDVSAESLGQLAPELAARGIFTSNLDQLDSDYDLIIVANVLHHVPLENRLGLLQEAASRLASDGRLIVFEHNPANPLTRRVVERCAFDRDAILLKPEETKRYFELMQLLEVRRDYILFFPPALKALSMLEAYLGWCRLGAQYAVVGRRG